MPTRPPCSRIAAIVSTAESPGGDLARRKMPSTSPSAVLISSPTMTVSSGGAASRARRAAVDAIVVGHGQVRQAALGGGADDGVGIGQRIEAGAGVAVQVDERPPGVLGRGLGRGLPSDLRAEVLLEEVEVLQGDAGAAGDAVDRVVGDVARARR